MNESPSARLDRLVGALAELGAQESCLAAQASWLEAAKIQDRFADIVAAICPLADSLGREGLLSAATKERVRAIMNRHRATAELLRHQIAETQSKLGESQAASGRISMIRPVYGLNRAGTAGASSVLNSSG